MTYPVIFKNNKFNLSSLMCTSIYSIWYPCYCWVIIWLLTNRGKFSKGNLLFDVLFDIYSLWHPCHYLSNYLLINRCKFSKGNLLFDVLFDIYSLWYPYYFSNYLLTNRCKFSKGSLLINVLFNIYSLVITWVTIYWQIGAKFPKGTYSLMCCSIYTPLVLLE